MEALALPRGLLVLFLTLDAGAADKWESLVTALSSSILLFPLRLSDLPSSLYGGTLSAGGSDAGGTGGGCISVRVRRRGEEGMS